MPNSAPGPLTSNLDQLHTLIHRAAGGQLPLESFVQQFRAAHEAIEAAGRPHYRSRDEARLIWDILWALEFYSPDPSREREPRDWNTAETVLAETRRVSQRLHDL
jgi:hypothetical protein